MLAVALLARQTASGLRSALAPKLSGGLNAAVALGTHPVQQRLLFSSVAALLGNAGQVNYSAANAALDTAAQLLQQQGGAAASLQWGPWAGGGMATPAVAASLAARGVGLVQPGAGLRLLSGLLANSVAAARAVVAPLVALDWGRMLRPAQKRSPFFAELALGPGGQASDAVQQAAPASHHQEAAGSAALSVQQVQEQLLQVVAGVLGATIEPAAAFMSAGLASLGRQLAAPLASLGMPFAIWAALHPSLTLTPRFIPCLDCRRRGAAQRSRVPLWRRPAGYCHI